MALFLKRTKDAFNIPETPRDSKKSEEAILREVVKSRSHGNVYLQDSRYYTSADVKAQYERLKNVNFRKYISG